MRFWGCVVFVLEGTSNPRDIQLPIKDGCLGRNEAQLLGVPFTSILTTWYDRRMATGCRQGNNSLIVDPKYSS